MKYQIKMTKAQLSETERRQRLAQLYSIFEQSTTEPACDLVQSSLTSFTEDCVSNIIEQPAEAKKLVVKQQLLF